MRQGAILSAVFHLAILVAVLLGLPTTSNPFEIGNPRTVAIVFADSPIAQVTNQVEGTSEPTAEVAEEPPTPPEKPIPEQMAALEPPPDEVVPPEPAPPVPALKDVPPPPTPEPVAQPSPEPTPQPTPEPAAEATPEPAPAPTPEPAAQPAAESEPVAQPAPAPTPEPTPEPTPVPEQVATAAPLPVPAPTPDPQVKPEPEPTPAPAVQPPTPAPEPVLQEARAPADLAPPEKPKKKVTLPQPVIKQEAKKQDPLDSILKDVTKREEEPQQKAQPQQQQLAAGSEPKTAGKNLGSRVSRTLQDAIGQQVAGCWNVDVGSKGIEELAVEVRAYMRPDGTVERAEVVDGGRYGSDGFFRSAADRALRAVNNPRCQPFPLPRDLYDEWSVIVFTFDPKVMF